MGLVGDLSSARLRDELIALLEEGEVEHSILRLAELGADRAIHSHLAADDEAVALIRRLTELRDRYELQGPSLRLGLPPPPPQVPPGQGFRRPQRPDGRRPAAPALAGAGTRRPRPLPR